MPPDREHVVLSLPFSARVAVGLAAVLFLAILAVLIAVLVSLEGTRSEIRTTRMGVTEAEQRFERVTDRVQPLLDAAAPLTEESSQRDLRRAGRTISEAAGEVPALASDARRGVGAAIFIAQILNAADLGTTLGAVRSFADAAVPAARTLVPAADRLLAELDRGGSRSLAACDDRLRTRVPSARGQIGCLLRTVPNVRGLLRSQRRINRESLGTQRDTRLITRRIQTLFAESLAIQREILERARSIDRKLPPPVTPPGP